MDVGTLGRSESVAMADPIGLIDGLSPDGLTLRWAGSTYPPFIHMENSCNGNCQFGDGV